ncbi:MAG: gamma-glutamylcyclotransferase family protein [Arenicellales bacterium]|nr:gamma-glutamylcyclotransferase family protein [Arenicellales bacterium]
MLKKPPLFVFGTLMDLDVLNIVLGRKIEEPFLRSATLAGFRCVRISDETYPVLVAQPNAIVEGCVLQDLTKTDWSRIRFFESYEYELEPCRIDVEGEGVIEAVYCSEGITAGTFESWILPWWQKHHKSNFLHLISAYMSLYGQASIDEAEALWAELQQRYDMRRLA